MVLEGLKEHWEDDDFVVVRSTCAMCVLAGTPQWPSFSRTLAWAS